MGTAWNILIIMSLSIYLHFPFCSNQCSYCDFYKEDYNLNFEKKYFEALLKETKLSADKIPSNLKTITSIFIGGGTPSLINMDLLEEWLNLLKQCFKITENIEFSLEANPESVDLDNLKRFQKLGITRPTFGIQSFNKKILTFLDRQHNPYHSQRAVYYTNVLGFKTFGVDQIFGIPGQTSRMLSDDIDQLVDLSPPHISFYQLTIEPGTPLGKRYKKGEFNSLEPELLLAMYKSGCEKFTELGYTRYEISSFAKPNHECRHNINYWNGGDYLGLGPSAHSLVNGERFSNITNVGNYIDSLNNNRLPRIKDDSSKEARMVETVMLGLRTMWGVDKNKFTNKYNQEISTILNMTEFNHLIDSGYIEEENNKIILTDEGIYLADEITSRLLT
jgi:oxygen-independent coproporphyrinogen-3 oxidase